MRLAVFLILILQFICPAFAAEKSFRRGVAVHLALNDASADLAAQSREARAVAAAGFDFVRLVVDPYLYLENVDEAQSAALNEAVLQATKAIEAQGLSVLVDFHPIPKSDEQTLGSEEYTSTPTVFAAYVQAAAGLAAVLEAPSGSLRAFEPFNEPVLDCTAGSAARWPEMALAMHRAIRQKAPNLMLVLEGACWATGQQLTQLTPAVFDDDQIIWSFHDYAPMIVTHQGASWVAGPPHWVGGLSYPPRPSQSRVAQARALARLTAAKHNSKAEAEQLRGAVDYYLTGDHAKAEMLQAISQVAAWAASNHVPSSHILLGEFGMISRKAGTEPTIASRAAFMRDKRSAVEALGWGWSVWEWGGSFGVSKQGQARVEPELAKALGLSPPAAKKRR